MPLETTSTMMFIALASGLVGFILIMFLPALFELRNPKDSGPRRITDEVDGIMSQAKMASLEKSEEIQLDQAIIKKIASIISILQDLES